MRTAGRQQPFVLLQPRARLQDVMPNVDFPGAAKSNRLPNLDSAFVGLIEESGSLFAMSPDRFPLVVFGDASVHNRSRSIEPPYGTFVDVDANDADTQTWKLCANGSPHRRCLTGVRRLEASSRSRLARLLDGTPTVPLSPCLKMIPLCTKEPVP